MVNLTKRVIRNITIDFKIEIENFQTFPLR